MASVLAARVIAIALASGFVAACAGVEDLPPPAGDAGPEAPSPGADAAVPLPSCSASSGVAVSLPPTDVMIVLDRSDAMAAAMTSSLDGGTGPLSLSSGSRFAAAAALVTQIVATFDGSIRFGYVEMPSRSACDPASPLCCVDRGSVLGPAPNNGQAIAAAVAAASPVQGGTPTAAALGVVQDFYDDQGDAVGNRYVLLVTGNAPNCDGNSQPVSGDAGAQVACADALGRVRSMLSSGIGVMVVAVGEVGAGPGCLATLASAGGVANLAASSGLYSADAPADIQQGLRQMLGAGAARSCSLSVGRADTSGWTVVSLGGQALWNCSVCPECGPSGASCWRWSSSPAGGLAVTLMGRACDLFQNYQVDDLEVHYSGCNPYNPDEQPPQ